MSKLMMRAANCSAKTAQWLTDLLREKYELDVDYKRVDGDAVICYGWGVETKLPTINGNAGKLNNLQQIETLHKKGNVAVPQFVTDIKRADFSRINFPMLARQSRHDGGGFDIMPVMQEEEIPWRAAAGADFFVEYIPRAVEYRVWVYRRQVLALYRKEMKHPEKYTGIGCNEKDGFEHVYQAEYRNFPGIRYVLSYAKRAVFDLGLDFGGVDIIVDKRGGVYVLEVNSAPGANGPEAVGLKRLANKINKWVLAGFPAQSKTYSEAEDYAE